MSPTRLVLYSDADGLALVDLECHVALDLGRVIWHEW